MSEAKRIPDTSKSMPMIAAEIKTRLVNEIKLRAYDDAYIDRTEEREILQLAVAVGLEVEPARSALAEICQELDYIVESDLVARLKANVKAAVGAGKIDKETYSSLVMKAQTAAKGRMPERELRKLVVAALRENPEVRVKTGWFTDWFATEQAELGV